MTAATEAKQYLLKDCKGSGIWSGTAPHSWWKDLAGDEILSYWPDHVPNTTCDVNDYVWRSAGGYVTDMNDLPIKQVYTGDTGDSGEEAMITIGPLMVR